MPSLDRLLAGPALTALILAAALIALAWPLIFQARALTGIDLQLIFYPYREYLGSAFADGRIPVWNPYAAMGVPFAANPLARVFYPIDWFFLPLAPHHALTASTLVHILLGGLGMWWFAARVLRVRPSARVLAAVAFALSGVMMARVAQPNFLVSIAWLPLVFLAASRVVAPLSVRWLALLALALALQFLGGHPQYTWMTLIALAPWMAFEAVRRRHDRPGRGYLLESSQLRAIVLGPARFFAAGVGAWAAALLLFAGLAAVQIVPAFRLWWLSARRIDFGAEAIFVHPLENATAPSGLFPLFQTIPLSGEVVGYLGFVAAGLAIAALPLAYRRGHTWFLAGMTALAILFAYGDQPAIHDWYYGRVPGFDAFRAPARWLAFSTFALAGLAALGLDALATPPTLRRRAVAAGIAAAGFTVAGVLVWAIQADAIGLFDETRIIWTAVGVPAAVLVLAVVLLGRRLHLLLPVAVAVELAFAAVVYDLSTGIPSEVYERPDPLAAALAADGFDGRVLSVASVEGKWLGLDPSTRADVDARYRDDLDPRVFGRFTDALTNVEAGVPNAPLASRLSSADLYDGGLGVTRQFIELQQAVIMNAGDQIDLTLRSKLGAVPESRALDLLNARYVVEDTSYDGVVDGIYVDLDLDLIVRPEDGPVRIRLREPFEVADVMGFSFLRHGAHLQDGQVGGVLTLIGEDGSGTMLELLAGRHTAEGDYDRIQGGPALAHALPGYTRRWRGNIRGYDSGFQFPIDPAVRAVAIDVAAPAGGAGELHFRGLTLRAPSGAWLPVPVRDGGRLQLLTAPPLALSAPNGLKIYRNDPVLPRVRVARRVIVTPYGTDTLVALSSPFFDAWREVVLQRDGPPLEGFRRRVRDFAQWLGLLPPRHGYGATADSTFEALRAAASQGDDTRLTLGSGDAGFDQVSIVLDEPERVLLRALLPEPGVVVLADSIYPDWKVRVDGREVPILRADHNFRGVLVPVGEHLVEFSYEPIGFRTGWIVSAVTAAVLATVSVLAWRRRHAAS